MPVLNPEVAAGFLVNRAGNADRRSAMQLASELGGLPLALEPAGAYIHASGGSLAEYLASFRQPGRPARQRRAHLVRQDGGHHLVAGVPSAGALRAAAAGLLRLLSCCAPEAIPLGLLLQPRPRLDLLPIWLHWRVMRVLAPMLKNPLAIDQAITELRRYSLVIPAGNRTYRPPARTSRHRR